MKDVAAFFKVLSDPARVQILWLLFNNPEPVSYTHLRAHETVLDLVCRLLLEKKNTKYTR